MSESKIAILLGSAELQVNADDVKTIYAATKAEVTAARKGIGSASLNHLTLVVNSAELPALFDPMELSGWQSMLIPGASISIRVLGDGGDLQPIHTSFLLAGLSGASERREADGSRVFDVMKKASKTVTSAPLKKKFDDLEDTDLVDEDDLLDEEANGILAPPSMAPRTAGDDCSGRKACDDCTCGRAELEGKVVGEPKPIQSSSCGNCSKGDAFRCAGCPYLGKPAFKAGEEHLVLDLMDDL